MKSARDSGELQMDTLKDEIDQLRTWKNKVAAIASVILLCVCDNMCTIELSSLYCSQLYFAVF